MKEYKEVEEEKTYIIEAPCRSTDRSDGRDVVWVKAGEAPEGDGR